jgi:hypothetical protein
MKENLNWKTIAVGLIILVAGILTVVFSKDYGVSIGCSLIASSVVALLNSLFVERKKVSPLDSWGIQNIYKSRSLMNKDCDISIDNAKRHIDIVAFGLKSFRTDYGNSALALLQKGVNIRIITMDPESKFVRQREIEEGEVPGQIKNTIEQLVEWAEKLNAESTNGKITIKGYSCMTLDFYWRVDDDIYVGPYWYKYPSQQTISYKFTKGDGFDAYYEYFDRLWNDPMMKPLVQAE